MKAARTHDLRLILSFEEDNLGGCSYYFKPRADVVYLNDDGEVRNPLLSSSWNIDQVDALGGLCLSAQQDETSPAMYGYELSYRDVYRLDARRAEVTHKVLRTLTGRLDKLNERFGYATDLAGHLGRFADALGCRSTTPIGLRREDGADHAGCRYRWVDVDGARHAATSAVEAWRAKHGIAA